MNLVVAAIAGFFVLAGVGVVLPRSTLARALVYFGSAGLSALLAVWAVAALVEDAGTHTLLLPVGLPWMSARLAVDGLSAFFLLVINLTGATASVFGFGYERGHANPQAGPVLPLYPLFLAGMNLVLIAADAFVFLVSWEFMSLASWLLVLSTHREPETLKAARLYLVMASFGTACLLLAFGLLAGAHGDYGFAAIRAHAPTAAAATLGVALALAGAGSKAGMVPLHVWLPLAHPAAPSHVSALMSGVMTKVAIYAIIRLLFDLMGEPSWWWGGVLLVFGTATAVLGVLYALMQDDLKKLLAYSTVENIGAILIALGMALVFKAAQTPVIAALAMAAALLHVINHSLFKSLLFFGSGAVLASTHTRDLGRMGGLIHRLPTTAVFVLIGAAAISALPPLNGFVGEWLLFQSILNAPALPQWGLKIMIAVVGAGLALSAALAGACFVRMYGIAFLGRPRGPEAAEAKEVDWVMRLGMAVPALLCIVIGVLPTPFLRLFEPAMRFTVEAGPFDDRHYQPWFWLAPTSAIGNSYNGLIMLVAIGGLSLVLAVLIHRFGSARVRRAIPWGCGCADPDPLAITQYTASSFAQPIRRAFGSTVFHATDHVDMPEPGDTRPASFKVVWVDPAWRFIYTPIGRAVAWVADHVDTLQFMTIRGYLSLMFAALVVLLIIAAAGHR